MIKILSALSVRVDSDQIRISIVEVTFYIMYYKCMVLTLIATEHFDYSSHHHCHSDGGCQKSKLDYCSLTEMILQSCLPGWNKRLLGYSSTFTRVWEKVLMYINVCYSN